MRVRASTRICVFNFLLFKFSIIRTSERIKKDKKDRLIDLLKKYFSEILFRTGNEKKAKY